MDFMEKNEYIPLCIPCMDGNERKYVDDCIDTGWISSVGHYVSDFENEFAKYTGSKKAVALASGTSALHLSLIVAGIKQGEEVFVPSLTFIAPVNAVTYVGASPVFIDVNRDDLGISSGAMQKFIDQNCEFKSGRLYNKKSQKFITAMIMVHICGYCCDVEPLMEIAEKCNLIVIEDAAEAIGCLYKGKHVGNFGHSGCFSFNGNKTLTTGGGGMAVSNDDPVAARIRHLSTQAKKDEFLFEHDEIGYNYRMNNVQAAIGLAQLERIEKTIRRKRDIHERYKEAFKSVNGLNLFKEAQWCRSNCWMGLMFVAPEKKIPFIEYMTALKIQVRPFWGLNHKQPMFRDCSCGSMENTQALYDSGISFPCGAHMEDKDVERVINAVKEFKFI